MKLNPHQFYSSEFRLRELDCQINKAKHKLEELRTRKRILVAKLTMITQALAAKKYPRTPAENTKETDEISSMVKTLLSIQDIPPPGGHPIQDDIGAKFLNMTLDEEMKN